MAFELNITGFYIDSLEEAAGEKATNVTGMVTRVWKSFASLVLVSTLEANNQLRQVHCFLGQDPFLDICYRPFQYHQYYLWWCFVQPSADLTGVRLIRIFCHWNIYTRDIELRR